MLLQFMHSRFDFLIADHFRVENERVGIGRKRSRPTGPLYQT